MNSVTRNFGTYLEGMDSKGIVLTFAGMNEGASLSLFNKYGIWIFNDLISVSDNMCIAILFAKY